MKAIVNICTLYTLLWCVYNIRLYGASTNTAGAISQIPLAINLLISFFFFIKVNLSNKVPIFLQGLNVLILMFMLYGGILIIEGDAHVVKGTVKDSVINNYSYIVGVLRSLLPIYSYYYFSKKGLLTLSNIKIWTVLFIVISTFYYVQTVNIYFSRYSSYEFTNNIGYLFLALLPGLLYFIDNKKVLFVGLFYIMIIILLCVKRGPIIIGILLSLYIFWKVYRYSNRNIKKWMGLSLGILLLCLARIFVHIYGDNEYLQHRIDETIEGNASGRDKIAAVLLNAFTEESNPVSLLFGHGANSTLDFVGNYAHNDWIEILVNQGLVGLLIFLVFWICAYVQFRQAKNVYSKMILLSVLGSYFLMTLFSMSYTSFCTYSSMILGFALYNTNDK